MKKSISLLFVFVALNAFSQDTVITISPKVTLLQDSAITDLLEKYKGYNTKREVMDGFRIQIMYTDVRDEAYKTKAALYREFPEIPSYVEYEQPYFKVRMGDFKTRLDATYYLQKIIALYTGAFIVRDKVRIK